MESTAFERNFTFYTVPAAFILLFLPKLYSFALGGKYLDPAHPRKYQPAIAEADDIEAKTKARILRAESAFANGLETVSLYAAAVASTHAARADPAAANALALAYLASRAAYNVVYVFLQGRDPRWALVRSAVWFAGVGLVLAMFALAGAAVY